MEKNKVPIIIASCISTFVAISALLAFADFTTMAKGSASSLNWMKNIDGEKYISEISLPGSHDSGAKYSIGDLSGKCQDVEIATQLTYGVRFLDIRLQYNGPGDFSIIHGIVDERRSYRDIHGDCIGFLERNPSETIIMSVKNEAGKNDDVFAAEFEKIIDEHSDYWYVGNDIPKLDQVRGKIVLFARYKNNNYGVSLGSDWRDPGSPDDHNTFDIVRDPYTYHIQDHYSLNKVEDKWQEAEECFTYTSNNTDKNVYCINFLSGVLKSGFPPTYSVPVAKYMNKQFLKEYKNYSSMGTVLFDFVSEDLAKAVYERNFS